MSRFFRFFGCTSLPKTDESSVKLEHKLSADEKKTDATSSVSTELSMRYLRLPKRPYDASISSSQVASSEDDSGLVSVTVIDGQSAESEKLVHSPRLLGALKMPRKIQCAASDDCLEAEESKLAAFGLHSSLSTIVLEKDECIDLPNERDSVDSFCYDDYELDGLVF